MPNSTLRRATETKQAVVVLPDTIIISLYYSRNSKHFRPYKIYLTKLSSQNAEPFLIHVTKITPNGMHVSEPNQYTILI